MNIDERTQGAVLVVRPRGPLIGEDAEQFKNCVAQAITRTLGRIVVDAAAIPFVDSRGLEVLRELSDEMSRAGRALKLCGLTETVREVLALTDLSESFDIYANENTALRSFL